MSKKKAGRLPISEEGNITQESIGLLNSQWEWIDARIEYLAKYSDRYVSRSDIIRKAMTLYIKIIDGPKGEEQTHVVEDANNQLEIAVTSMESEDKNNGK